MTVYWLDPYFASTNHGNGTTDTSTRSGTYAAPFSFADVSTTSATLASSINGVSLASGDEIRIKGLPFDTLFPSSHTNTNAYTSSSQYSSNLYFSNYTVPASADDLSKNQATGIIAYEPSQVAEFCQNSPDNYLIGSGYFSSTTSYAYQDQSVQPYKNLNILLYKKYESQPYGSKVTIRSLDANYYDNTTSVTGSTHLFLFELGDFGGTTDSYITVSAGWTSTTARGGISLFTPQFQNNWKYLFLAGYTSGNNRVKFDVNELWIHAQKDGTLNTQVYTQAYMIKTMAKGTYGGVDLTSTPDKMPNFTNFYSIFAGNEAVNTNDIYFGKMFANSMQLIHSEGGSNTVYYPFVCQNNQDENKFAGDQFTGGYSGIHFKFGTYLVKYVNVGGSNPYLFKTQFFANFASVSFQANGWVQILRNNQTDFTLLAVEGTYGDSAGQFFPISIDSTVRNPADPNDAYYMTNYEPVYSDMVISNATGIYQSNVKLVASNWTDKGLLMSDNALAANSVISCGVLNCNGANYKATNSVINHVKGGSEVYVNPLSNGLFPLYQFESNDYDGKALGVLPSARDNYGFTNTMLYYNDSSNNIVIQRSNAQLTANSDVTSFYFPLEVVAPTYTQASNTLRISLGLSRSNTTFGSDDQITLHVFYRDSSQSSGFRVESGSSFAVSTLATDVASPTTKTLALSNLPTSGQDKITSALSVVQIQINTNANLDYSNFYRIHSSALEVV